MSHSTVLRSASSVVFLAVLGLVALPRPALAEDRVPSLPEAAYAACASKAEGNACTLQARGGHGATSQGVCSADRQGQKLVCRPFPPKPRS